MKIKDLNDKMIAVAGGGLEGRSTVEYLLKHGVKPVLFDERPWEEWDEQDQKYIKSLTVNFIFGKHAFTELAGFDVVFRSPGIALEKLKIESQKYKVISQTKWFFDNCPAKIIGVTGTKGKGTTASLIFEILKKRFQISNSKFQIYLTGNIGKVQPFEILDGLKPEDYVVYELSSFQLQDLDRSPHIGVCLMVTSEHLDYHKDQREYWDAKAPIVKYQNKNDYAIVNTDYDGSLYIGKKGEGKKIQISTKQILTEGVWLENEHLKVQVLGKNFQFSIFNFQLRGKHNLENIGAAVGAAVCAGCSRAEIEKAVKEFKGLEHRLEFVTEKNGIKYYNDSFSTTPETAIAAINSFSEPLILILGGSSKNSDFTELGKTICSAKNIKAIILVGQEGLKIKQSMHEIRAKVFEGAKNMEEILAQANSISKKGDVVLLSPACASFGMFKNYKDRGEKFKSLVTNNK